MTPRRIPPEVRTRLAGLQLQSRTATGAERSGMHTGRRRGMGQEFEQYRNYEPGDEPRRVDWKLYARSDRIYVREAVRDSTLHVWLAVDTSLSMTGADGSVPGYTKLDAACQLAACICDIALRQGDQFALQTVGADAMRTVALGTGTAHRARLLHELGRLAGAGAAPAAAALRPLSDRIQLGDLLILLTDGFDDRLSEWCMRLSGAGRDVRSIGLLTAAERDFPFAGEYVFRDPESGAARRVAAAPARDAYLERFRAARIELRRQLAGAGVRHVDHVLDQALDVPLRRVCGA